MAAEHSYFIARASDQFVFEAFEKIKALHQRGSTSYRLIGIDRELSGSDGDSAALLKQVFQRGEALLNRANLGFPHLAIEYIRGTEKASSDPSLSVFDQIKFRF